MRTAVFELWRRPLEIVLLAISVLLIAAAAVVVTQMGERQRATAQISNNNLTFAGSAGVVELLRLQRALTRLPGDGADGALREARLRADILATRASTLSQGKFGQFARAQPHGPATIERLSALAARARQALRSDVSTLDAERLAAELGEMERPLLVLASLANQAGGDEVAAGQDQLRRLLAIGNWTSFALVACGAILLATVLATRRSLRASNERLDFLAHHDALTRLPNRALLMRRLAETGGTALAILDLDGFKAVNDTHGHATGDRLLVAVADRLRAALGDEALPCRLGGDEFALLSATGPERFHAVVEGAVASLRRPFMLGDLTITVGASAGVASRAGRDPGDLMARADAALYRAKRAGKGRVEVHRGAVAAPGFAASRAA